MQPDYIAIISYKFIILFIYGSITVITAIFTFFIELYNRLDDLFNVEFLSIRHMNPLYANINFVDDWLIGHRKTIGPILILLSVFDTFKLLEIVNFLL